MLKYAQYQLVYLANLFIYFISIQDYIMGGGSVIQSRVMFIIRDRGLVEQVYIINYIERKVGRAGEKWNIFEWSLYNFYSFPNTEMILYKQYPSYTDTYFFIYFLFIFLLKSSDLKRLFNLFYFSFKLRFPPQLINNNILYIYITYTITSQSLNTRVK